VEALKGIVGNSFRRYFSHFSTFSLVTKSEDKQKSEIYRAVELPKYQTLSVAVWINCMMDLAVQQQRVQGSVKDVWVIRNFLIYQHSSK